MFFNFNFFSYYLFLFRCFSSRVIRDSTVSVKMIPAQFTEFDFTKKIGADKYTDSYFYGLFWKNGEISFFNQIFFRNGPYFFYFIFISFLFLHIYLSKCILFDGYLIARTIFQRVHENPKKGKERDSLCPHY